MFSGIIRGIGLVSGREDSDQGARVQIQSEHLKDVALGDSVAVLGVCLTVSQIGKQGEVAFDVSSETLRKTNLGELRAGSPVNLEHPLRLSDLVHGHIVQGHVDGVGTLVGSTLEGETIRWTVAFPPELRRYFVPKGSVTIDGVSLTLGEVGAEEFSLYIIPKTWEWTTLRERAIGDRLNIECDIFAKYVEQMVKSR